MPNIAVYHPQIVHFVVALLYVGLGFRLIGLLGRPKWINPAAATLLVLGTIASVAAVRSGTDAHGPVERIPGANDAVVEHEEWGERARNVFLIVAAVELIALALSRKEKAARLLRVGSALAGIAGGVILYEAAEHGGHLVYQYAGGVGTRSGDPEDVKRLLVAGLFNEANLQRRAGDSETAARLTEELLRVRPDDPALRILYARSLFTDRNDARAALDVLAMVTAEPGDRSTDVGKGMLAADAYEAIGEPDSARAVLRPLIEQYPSILRLKGRLDAIK